MCNKVIKHKRNLDHHIRSQHGGGTPAVCCPISKVQTFKTEASVGDNWSRKHGTSKRPGAATGPKLDWPIVNIQSDLIGADEARVNPGSPTSAPSGDPVKVALGNSLVAGPAEAWEGRAIRVRRVQVDLSRSF